MTRGYLIGENFRDRIESTIARVNGTPYGGLSDARTPRVDSPQQPAQGSTIRVKISQGYPTLNHTPLAVGQGLSIPLNRSNNTRLTPAVDAEKLSGGRQQYTVASESDLTAFASGSSAEFYIEHTDTDVSLGSRCGIIKSVDDEVDEQGYWNCVVQVRGLVRCRVLLLQAGASVSPPPPYPDNAGLRAFWRRYLMATEYGYGAILGIGARYRMNGTNTYPAIAEAVVNLG